MLQCVQWSPTTVGLCCERVFMKTSIVDMQRIAQAKGGRCLSREYIRGNAKLLWQCKEGHQWEAVPHNIKRRRWCPVCATKPKSTIEEMQRVAEARGGKCLS